MASQAPGAIPLGKLDPTGPCMFINPDGLTAQKPPKTPKIWPYHRAIFGTLFQNLSVWYGQIWREKKGVPVPQHAEGNVGSVGSPGDAR